MLQSHLTSPAKELKNWLVAQGLQGTDRNDLLRQFCERLVNVGIPLVRMQLGQRAFHPQFGGIGFNWSRADGMSHEYFARPDQASDEWINSPFYYMIANSLPHMALSLIGEEGQKFPIFEKLRAMGGTGYYAIWQPIGPITHEDCDPEQFEFEGVISSWTCDGEDGMSPEHQELIRECFSTLVMVLANAGTRQMGSELLKVYLGRDAGQRVLSGEIQRGTTQLIDAVVCMFDLNGFTALSEQLPGGEVVEMLNDYLEHVVQVIQSNEGNILKFLGDGVLAMFNIGTLEEDARAALNAAAELHCRLGRLSQERAEQGLHHTGYTLTLHAGEILYGNIGADNRLDFTVIGPTVNLTARMSDLHRAVDREVLLSDDVRRAAGETKHDLVSVGRYMLRGVAAPLELFTIHIAAHTENDACVEASSASIGGLATDVRESAAEQVSHNSDNAGN